ncbi:MAG: spermidine/putrescine transport system substrate-binding protein [Gaiellales bacterium]|nr:spermidine/putrescine transport system substrate-binding protein [Mycobacterium sp.]MDX6573978.1 spermidine/putrescine transport system substrate-binding protein [Gaiellales bacterium]
MHPMDRRFSATRRDFLKRTGGAAFALSAAGLLEACSNSTSSAPPSQSGAGSTGPVGPGGLPLARPDGPPVELPLWEDPIASGLEPETGGDFTVFNYPYYIYGKLLKDFGKKYNVTVKVTPFDDINTGVTRLASGTVQPDVTEMTPDNLDRVVAGKLIKPLNLDYIPNLKANVWPSLADPFYDKGSRYGVPYTCYSTGIAWRTDRVKEDIQNMANPWDIFWQSQAYSGKVALLSEVRETIALALLRKGITDINTEDPKLINQAVSDLKELYGICNIKVGDLQYETVPEDKAWLNQAWSGDMLAGVFYYLQKPSDANLLRFYNPPVGKGPIQNDMWCVCATTKKPVLAHLFLNYMLDNGVAYSNFVNFNGYQPPLNEIDPDQMVAKGLIPETLANSVLTADDLGPNSIQEMTLTNTGQALWQNGYADFQSGA